MRQAPVRKARTACTAGPRVRDLAHEGPLSRTQPHWVFYQGLGKDLKCISYSFLDITLTSFQHDTVETWP